MKKIVEFEILMKGRVENCKIWSYCNVLFLQL